jgi:hypothetical protein
VCVALCGACAGAAEHAVLDRFFSASRLRDFTALENVSTVIFEPRQDGTVLAFDIARITPMGPDAEEVLVNATVHLPSGRTERRPLVVTLRRVENRWMVAAVKVSTESTSDASPRQ